MCRSPWIILDSFNGMFSRLQSEKIHGPYSSFCPVAAMPDCDFPTGIAAAYMLSFSGEGERTEWAAFEEVVVYGSSEVADSGCTRFVGAESEGGFDSVFGTFGSFVGVSCNRICSFDWSGRDDVDSFSVGAGERVRDGTAN